MVFIEKKGMAPGDKSRFDTISNSPVSMEILSFKTLWSLPFSGPSRLTSHAKKRGFWSFFGFSDFEGGEPGEIMIVVS